MRRIWRRSQRALIVCYHRVAEAECDPWDLCVSPRAFNAQLDALSRLARPVRLRDISAWLDGDRSALPSGTSFAVTFDDGYADLLRDAMPTLAARNVPVTVFLTSGLVGSPREPWWDELERIILRPGSLPPVLRFQPGGDVREWRFERTACYDPAAFARFRGWKAGRDTPPTERQAAYVELCDLLRVQVGHERDRMMEEIVSWSGQSDAPRSTHRLLSADEARELAADSLVEIGCHGRTHVQLTAVPASVQEDELVTARAELETLFGSPVQHVSYPHGVQGPQSVALVRAAGYRSACTTTPGLIDATADPFRLPRVVATDGDLEHAVRRLLS
jgi:peptidoglycan/xylan/chitin deacetylase (PgdA/CDA1 family)